MRPSAPSFGRLARFALAGSLLSGAALAGCDNTLAGDPPATVVPTALGNGDRISQVCNPDAGTASGATVTITGATYLITDTYDETANGKSKGTVYLQDFGSQVPWSGTSLFSPTYEPASLVLAPGDVVDLTGTYTVNTTLTDFPAGTGLIQIDKPVVLPRFDFGYEKNLSNPVVINVSDLDGTFLQGGQWSSMLVTIENVTLPDSLVGVAGRYTVHLTSDVTSNGPTLTNELFDVQDWNSSQSPPPLTKGTKLKSLTGIVTWFFNYHIAPRSPADIVVQ